MREEFERKAVSTQRRRGVLPAWRGGAGAGSEGRTAVAGAHFFFFFSLQNIAAIRHSASTSIVVVIMLVLVAQVTA